MRLTIRTEMNKNETEARPNGIHAFPKHARHEALHHPRDTQTDERPIAHQLCGRQPCTRIFPEKEIAAASARLLAQDPVGMLQYSVTEGVPAVLEQVRRFANRHELRVRRQDALLLCTGSQQVLDLATKCLCNEGDTIAVEDPAFLGAYNTFRSYGAKLAGVPMEEDGVSLAALEAVFAAPEKPRFFYCIPNFQNPTGKTMSLVKRRGVLALARKYGVPVLEDDPYGELPLCRRARAQHQKPGRGKQCHLCGQLFQNSVPGHAPCLLRVR